MSALEKMDPCFNGVADKLSGDQMQEKAYTTLYFY